PPGEAFDAICIGCAAAGATLLGLFLWRGHRWARWLAIGSAIDVLANVVVAFAFGSDHERFVGFERLFAKIMAAGALLLLLLLARPAVRQRFEPDWNTPVHHAYRWTAIAVAACTAHAIVGAFYAFMDGAWGLVTAAALMLLAIALLSRGKVVGLPLAAAALV